jgi:hypothetical protein
MVFQGWTTYFDELGRFSFQISNGYRCPDGPHRLVPAPELHRKGAKASENTGFAAPTVK